MTCTPKLSVLTSLILAAGLLHAQTGTPPMQAVGPYRTSTVTMTNAFATTGLALPSIPASTVRYGQCKILWQMSSVSYTATFGVGMSAAPTGLWGSSRVTYAAAGTSNYLTFTQTATTATAISTAATAGVAATTYMADINFTIQTGSSAVVVTLYGMTSSTSGTLTIMPGSYCAWLR
jgi:hypothetical protein